MKILWAAMVYQADLKYLRPYIESILGGLLLPDEILIVDAGSDEAISSIIDSFDNESLRYFSLGKTETNKGFNASFNFSVKYAIDNSYDLLATMTVRAIPDKAWLKASVETIESSAAIGMVTTLHLAKSADKIHGVGHFLGPSGGLYDYAKDLQLGELDALINFLENNDFEPIWAPCSGGAIYSVQALHMVSPDISKSYEVLHPAGFKSYNCSHLGYLMKAHGFRNAIARYAFCIRDDSESTSRNPTSCGLLFNQEINRIASLYTYWPEGLAQDALSRYMSENRRSVSLSSLDKRIILTLAENLRRNWIYRESIGSLLHNHLDHYASSRDIIRQHSVWS